MTAMPRNRRTAGMPVSALAAALALGLGVVPSNAAQAEPRPAPASYPAYQGPKKTIAVANFDANGAFVARYGGAEVGGGIAAMLISELRRTDRFIVVERAEVDRLLNEKQMGLTGVASSPSAQQPLLGAQLFLRGSVTEFSEQDKGGGLSLGFALGGFSNALGSRNRRGTIAIDLRLIDAATGVVVSTYTTRRTLKSSSVGLQSGKGAFSIGTDSFSQTPLGQAAREVIGEAVQRLVAAQEQVPWQSLVARVEGSRVYVNAGRNANLVEGSRVLAIRTVNTVTDPATGEVLGTEKATLGEIVLDQIEDRYAVGTFSGGYALAPGDTIRLAPGAVLAAARR